MKYFLKKTTPSKKGIYYQIYQSAYIPGKGSRNKSYSQIGYHSDLLSQGINDPEQYAKDLVKKLNDSLGTSVEKQIGEITTQKNVGYFLIKSIFDYLNIDKDINIVASSFHKKYNFSEFLRTMTYAQIYKPGSKKELFEKVTPTLFGCEKYSYDQILDGVNSLGSDCHKWIEVLNKQIKEKFDLDYSKGYFDCTNFYFEIDQEDEYRKRGPSKENRSDPIIGMALLLSNDVVPIDMNLYPGNESEKPQLRERIEAVKETSEFEGKIIQVADKGLNCARNIYAAVKEANDGYIFSKSIHGKNLTKIEKKWVLLEDDVANVWHTVKDANGKVLYKYKEWVTIDEHKNLVNYDTQKYRCKLNPDDKKETEFEVTEKRIVTYNPSLAAKKRQEIKRMVEKLSGKLSANKILKNELGELGKYVVSKTSNQEGEIVEIAYELNKEKIEEDLTYAGYNMLVTAEINVPAAEIYKIYHQLWRIEHCFRTMKTYLEARPVYLQKEYSIYGHFLIVYFALTLLRLLELKVFKDEIPVEQIIEFIRDYNVTENYDGTFINNASDTKTYRMIKEKYCLSKLGNVYLKKKDIENILDASF